MQCLGLGLWHSCRQSGTLVYMSLKEGRLPERRTLLSTVLGMHGWLAALFNGTSREEARCAHAADMQPQPPRNDGRQLDAGVVQSYQRSNATHSAGPSVWHGCTLPKGRSTKVRSSVCRSPKAQSTDGTLTLEESRPCRQSTRCCGAAAATCTPGSACAGQPPWR